MYIQNILLVMLKYVENLYVACMVYNSLFYLKFSVN